MKLQIQAWGRKVELTLLSVILLMGMSTHIYFFFIPNKSNLGVFYLRSCCIPGCISVNLYKYLFCRCNNWHFSRGMIILWCPGKAQRCSRSSGDVLEHQGLLSSLPSPNWPLWEIKLHTATPRALQLSMRPQSCQWHLLWCLSLV